MRIVRLNERCRGQLIDLIRLGGLHCTFYVLLDWDFIVLVGLIVRKHLLDVNLRFSNPRDVAFHPMDPCIIRCECQPQITMV